MHFVQAKHILSPHNGLNLYRGCTHGCIYCDSRSKCYNMQHEFTDIEIKANALELLDAELAKKRKKVVVGTGSMSDPYMHIEADLQMTRKMLEIIDKWGCGVEILTKSTLILRDLDLYKRINQHSTTLISMTLTTADDQLCKIIEPNVAVTSERIAALKTFHEHGITTGVWLCPFLPFINDDFANLKALLDACLQAHVKYIVYFGIGLTLREGNREYFYQQLDRFFPGLRNKYDRYYGLEYEISSPNNLKLSQYFCEFCEKHQIIYKKDEVFRYMSKYESHSQPRYQQLSLFDEMTNMK